MQLVQICKVIYLDLWSKLSANFCVVRKSFNNHFVLVSLINSELHHTLQGMSSKMVIVYSHCFRSTLMTERLNRQKTCRKSKIRKGINALSVCLQLHIT